MPGKSSFSIINFWKENFWNFHQNHNKQILAWEKWATVLQLDIRLPTIFKQYENGVI